MQRALTALIIAIGALASGAITHAASYPYNNGVTASMAPQAAASSCAAGRLCPNVRTTNTCNDGGTAICGPYSASGGSSNAAGKSSTSGDGTIASETIYSGGERLYNNTNTGRAGCVYALTGWDGGSGYRRADAGAGWKTAPFTGFHSIALVPNTTGWVCWP